MITITAILRARPGHEAKVRDGLLEVAAEVARSEPGTVGYFVSQSIDEPQIFTTYERFVDRAAMERHDGSAAVARFVQAAGPSLAEKVLLYTSNELSAKIA